MSRNVNFEMVSERELECGYEVVIKIQANGKELSDEYTLMRFKKDADGVVKYLEEYASSKHMHRVLKEYEKLKTGNCMEVEETIKNLTIPQLESLLPSYYQYVIVRRIEELKKLEAKPKPVEESLAQPVIKKTRKKSANTKTKRSRKASTKVSD